MDELIHLWEKTLGTPPAAEQFDLWHEMHNEDVIRQAILKTAGKDLSLGKAMSLDYKIRFASKVMLTQTERNREHGLNRARLSEEFDGKRTEGAPCQK